MLGINWWVEQVSKRRAVSRPRAAFQSLICNVTEGTAAGRPSASCQPQREGQTDRQTFPGELPWHYKPLYQRVSGFLPLTWPFVPQRLLTNLPQQLAKPEVTQLGPQKWPFFFILFSSFAHGNTAGKTEQQSKGNCKCGRSSASISLNTCNLQVLEVSMHLNTWKNGVWEQTSVAAKVHWNPWFWTSPCVPPVLCYMGFSGSKLGWIQIDVSYTIFRVLFDFNYFLTVLLFEKSFSIEGVGSA